MRSLLVLATLIAACASETRPTNAPEHAGDRAIAPALLACADMVCPPEAHCEVESRYYLDPRLPEGQQLQATTDAICVMDDLDAEPVAATEVSTAKPSVSAPEV